MTVAGFCIDWQAGPTAQVEIFSPPGSRGTYQLKYAPPFRSTIRPPLMGCPLGPEELGHINDQLNQLVTETDVGRSRGDADTEPESAATAIDLMKTTGRQLWQLIIPRDIEIDFRGRSSFFLEIGMDQALLEYPWELMHDEENFLCLKHSVGRFVNARAQAAIPQAELPRDWVGKVFDKISILLISVPSPRPRGDIIYDQLPEAQEETNAICDLLNKKEGVEFKLLHDRAATYTGVWQALQEMARRGGYHIIHFNGHARFDDRSPRQSGLVLYDRDMTTGEAMSFFGRTPPILSFMNACETGRTAAWKTRYDIFGLGLAFLQTGSYLLGSRWKLRDRSAAEFSSKFYSALIMNDRSLGTAIMEARKACKAASPPGDFSWASYVFYGDPRLCFRRRA